MPEEIEALTALLEADIRKFEKGMGDAFKLFDQRSAQIEKRQEALTKKLQSGFALGNIGNAIVGGAALYGLERFVTSVADAATKIQTTAQAVGVGTDALQEWGAIAEKSGVNQEQFNTSLDRFAKNLGEAQIKGGPLAAQMKTLGVDIHATTETAFLQFADAIAKTGSQSQKTALVVQLLGRDAANLVPFFSLGKDAIKAMAEEIKRTGGIIDHDGLQKINQASVAWGELKRQLTVTGANVLSGFAGEFTEFTDKLKDPAFQESLRNFGKILADAALAIGKIAVEMPVIVAALVGARFGGLGGAAAAVGLYGAYGAYERQTGQVQDSVPELMKKLRDAEARAASERGDAQKGAQQQVAALQAQLAHAMYPSAPAAVPGAPKGTLDRSNLLAGDSGKQVAKAAEEAAKAYQELVKAIDAGNVEILKGTLDVFGQIRKQIDDTAQAELHTAEAERDAKLAALADEVKKGTVLESDAAKVRESIYAESASREFAIVVQAKDQRLQVLRDETNARFEAEQAVVEQRRETVKSEQGLILELAKGSQDYYKLARDLSDEQAKLEEQNIQDRLKRELDALDAQYADADKASLAYSNYQQTRANAVTTAELKIQAIENGAAANRVRLNEDETHALENQIAIMDQLRGGLENIGASALHGAQSFKSAVAQMIEQLAEMALKLYILKPLIESVLGRSGTDTSFLLSALGIGGASPVPSSVGVTPQVSGVGTFQGGFASGGTLPPGSWGIAGEHGPEPIFAGRTPLSVIPQMPGVPNVSSPRPAINVSIVHQNSFAGAVDANSMKDYADQAAEASTTRAVQIIKQNFPGLMVNAQKRNF